MARQLEAVPAAAHALRDIKQALGSDMPLFYDGGLRAEEDVLKTLVSGADFAFFGRIFQFAIAAAGEEGLNRLWDVLSDELSIAMAQVGLRDLQNTSEVVIEF